MKLKAKILTLVLALAMLFSIIGVIAIPAGAATTKTVYFTNTNGWSSVYAYAWYGSSSTTLGSWPGTKMTYVETNDLKQDIYSIDVPTSSTKIIFHNNSGVQSLDTTISSTANGYYPKASSNNYTCGTYTYTPTVFYVAGTKGLCSVEWNEKTDAMTHSGNGIHTIVLKDVPAGNHAYKITNGTWDKAWPSSDKTFTTTAISNVTITFNAKTQTVSHSVHYHSYSSAVTTQPGCESEGVTTYTCSCGDSYTTAIDATGHTYDNWVDQIDATCTTSGTLGHYDCPNCDKNFDSEQNALDSLEIPAGHNYGSWNEQVDATCEKDGTLGHYQCSKCNKYFDTNKTELDSIAIPAGHNYSSWKEQVDATCEKDGTLGHYQCSECNKYFDTNKSELDSIVIKSSGHNYSNGTCSVCDAKDPNYVATIKLSVPGGVDAVEMGEGNKLPEADAPDGYTFAGWSESVINETTVEPTILKAGSVYSGEKTVLYAVYTRTETVAGTASFEKVTSAPATWSGQYLIVYETGKVAFNGALGTLDATNNTVSVTISGTTITVTEELLNAVFTISGSGSNITIKSANEFYIGRTATSNGLNSDKTTKYYNTISFNNGNVVIKSSGGPTLQYNKTSGQNRFRYFSSSQQAIQLYEYKVGEGSTTTYYCTLSSDCEHNYVGVETTAPGCETKGVTTYTCSECGYNYTEEIDAIGHTEATVPGKAATCTETGLTDGVKCSVCHAVITAQETIPTIAHDYVDSICSVCGAKEETTASVTISIAGTTGALAGDSSSISWTSDGFTVVNEKGSTAIRTSDSDHYRVYANSTTTISGSKITKVVITCTSGDYASVCGKSLNTTGATAVVDGSIVTITVNSGTLDSIEIGAIEQWRLKSVEITYDTSSGGSSCEHNYEGLETTAPGCETTGVMTYTCSKCGDSYEKVIDATGHSYTSEVTTEPTCTATGVETYTCSGCGDTYTESVLAKGHNYDAGTCTVCGAVEPSTYSESLGIIASAGILSDDSLSISWAGKDFTFLNEKYNSSTGIRRSDEDHFRVYANNKSTISGSNIKKVVITCTSGTYANNCANALTTEGVVASVNGSVVTFEVTSGTVDSIEFVAEDQWRLNKIDVYYLCDNHSYDNACDADCNICGATRVTTHIPGEAADCENAQTCTVCGFEIAKALGHAEVSHEAKDPTCTNIGWDAYVTCSRCSYTTYVEEAAPGHSFTPVAKVPATCTETGIVEHKKCTVCNMHFDSDATALAGGNSESAFNAIAENIIAALGHDMVSVAGKAATCLTPGYTDHFDCSRCDYTEGKETIPAINHGDGCTCTYVKVENDANWSNVYVHYWNESGDTTEWPGVAMESGDGFYYYYIPAGFTHALYHNNANKEADKVQTANLTVEEAKEYKTSWTKVAFPGSYNEWNTNTVVYIDGVPTMTIILEKGTYNFKVIDNGEWLGNGGTIENTTTKTSAIGWEMTSGAGDCTLEATGGIYTFTFNVKTNMLVIEWKCVECEYTESVTKPTCVSGGYTTHICNVCGDSYIDNEVGATGEHTFTNYTVNGDATCIEDGTKTAKCDYCDEEDTIAAVGSALGHDKVTHEKQDPTCTNIGWDAYETCSRCDYSTYEEKAALNHNKVSHEAKAPTCTEIGWDAYETCSRCDYTTKVEKSALNHDWADATCTAPQTCKRDGCNATQGEANGHSYAGFEPTTTDDVKNYRKSAPSCTSPAVFYQRCTVCNASSKDDTNATFEYGDALGHDEQSHAAQAPTCTEKGWDAYVTCSRCDYSTYEEKAALGHDEVSHEAKAPTCTNIGWDAYVTCSRCSYTTYVEEAALGHSFTPVAKVPATCTETGIVEHKKCTVCNRHFDSDATALAGGNSESAFNAIAENIIAALGHKYSSVVVTEPTFDAQGYTTYTCVNGCGHSYKDSYVDAKVAVAIVGGVKYETFLEALNAAAAGGASEIKVLEDVREVMPTDVEIIISEDLKITADEAVKIEFYNNGTYYDFIFNSEDNNDPKTLTIGENVTFDLTDRVIWLGYYGNNIDIVVDGELAAYQIWHGADTTVSASGVLNSHSEALVMRRGATLTVNGGEVEANYFSILSGNIVANDATIECGPLWISNTDGFANEGSVSVTLNNSTLTSSGNLKATSSGNEVKITLNSSEATFADFDGYGASVIDANSTLAVNGDSTLNIKTVNNSGEIFLEKDATIVTTTEDLEIKTDKDYKVVYENGSYVPVECNYVAQVGDAKFESLAEAFEAAKDGDTITLLADLEIESDLNNAAKGLFNVAEGTKLTLDLGGHTINVTDNSEGNFIVFYNYGDLTVKNGTVNLTATNDRSWNAQSTIILNRGGNLTVESGTFAHKGGTSMAFALDNSANSFGDAYMTINGGNITSTYIAIRMRMADPSLNGNPGNGVVYLTVNGGSIEGGNRGIWGQITNASNDALGELAVTGGTITGGKASIDMAVDEHENISVSISGTPSIIGAIKGDVADYEIKGGSFTTDVSAYCEKGKFDCVPDDNGGYKVVTHEHKWLDADCITPATCSGCEATNGQPLGHAEVPHEAQAPTCTEIGWDAYVTCSRCDYTTYEEKAATGHTEEAIPKVEPSCAVGYTAGVKCSVCDEILVAPEEIPATGEHVFNTQKCENCETYADVIIGNVYYATLADAVEVGGEITLLANANLGNETLVIDKSVTIGGNFRIESSAKQAIIIRGDGITVNINVNILATYRSEADCSVITISGKDIVINITGKITTLQLTRTGSGSYGKTVITAEDVDNVKAIIRSEFVIDEAKDIIFSGDPENISLSVKAQYASLLARYGYVTVPSSTDPEMVDVSFKTDYYIGANGNWWIGGIDTGIPATGAPGQDGEDGEPGLDGSSVTIDSIVKTGSEGLVDTYTITFTNGTVTSTATFTVTNGAQGIQGIQGPKGEDGHSPIITIQDGYWYIDGTNTEKPATGLKGDTGNGISGVVKTGTEGLVDTYTITFTDGTTTTFTVTNGAQGIQGIQGEKGDKGDAPVITIQDGNWYIDGVDSTHSAVGPKGDTGNGISGVVKTGTEGLVDTYTITFTDGTTTTFTVTNGAQGIQGIQGEKGDKGDAPVITIQDGNWYIDGVDSTHSAVGPKGETGNGISEIKKTCSEGLVDTYTITFTDGTTTTFTVTNGAQGIQGIQGIQGEKGDKGDAPVITIQDGNWYIDGVDSTHSAVGPKGETGNGISGIEKTGTDGLVDTYTITFTDGTTTTFTVTNGAQGIQGIQGEKGDKGDAPVITIQDGNWYIDGVDSTHSAVGPKGETGNGISEIKKTGSEGLVDTYTITFTDGTTTTFTITNGAQGIQGIQGEKGDKGDAPVITIQDGNWYIDGVDSTHSAVGPKGDTGNGISGVVKTGTEGLVDTYTITFTDGTTTTFTVTNGAQGNQGIQGIPGKDGHTPVITIQDGKWFIDGVDTGKPAVGIQGPQGEPGKTPHVGDNGNWWIGEVDTQIPATGEDGTDGETPYIGANGNWWIGAQDTGVAAQGKDGNDNNKIVIICIAIAALCIITTIVAVSTKKFRRPWWIIC